MMRGTKNNSQFGPQISSKCQTWGCWVDHGNPGGSQRHWPGGWDMGSTPGLLTAELEAGGAIQIKPAWRTGPLRKTLGWGEMHINQLAHSLSIPSLILGPPLLPRAAFAFLQWEDTLSLEPQSTLRPAFPRSPSWGSWQNVYPSRTKQLV